MYTSHTAHNGPVIYLHMAGNLRITCKNGVISNLAVMSNVHISHDPVIATNSGNANILSGTRMNSCELSHSIAITHN